MPINKTGIKKDGKTQYRVRVNYTDATGKAHQVERTAYGNAEAVALEQQLISEFKNKRTVTSRLTVKQLFDEYEVYHSHETRKTSHDSTMRSLRLRVLPTMADCRLDKLSQPVLAKWKNEIAAADLSIITKQNAYGAFAAMLNYAVKMEYIQKNPLTVLGNFRNAEMIEKPADKLQFYTPEQFIAYISVARERAVSCADWGYYVFFSIAFYTGARKGEINALKWSDIDGDILHIRRSIAQKLKGGDVETPPKYKSSYRDLQIPAPLMEILSEHKERQKEASRLFTEGYRICGGERPLRDTSIENKNKAFSKAAGLPHIRIHDFRHTFATHAIASGVDAKTLSGILGHTNASFTLDTYTHVTTDMQKNAAKIVGNFMDDIIGGMKNG